MTILICSVCGTDTAKEPSNFRTDACSVCGSQEWREKSELPATCGECKSMAVSGLLTLCADREAKPWFRVVEQCAPPSTCPKRPKTEKPLPIAGGGDRWGNLMAMMEEA